MQSPVSFAGIRRVALANSAIDIEAELANTQVVILGAPESTPYVPGQSSHAAAAPAAIRAAMARYGSWHDHYDFDLGRPFLSQIADELCDGGDLPGSPDTPAQNRDTIKSAVIQVLNSGAHPIIIGGDDAVPIPVFQAFEAHGPIWILQVDAHIDWRQERFGEPLGWSSTMRRASQMGWVAGIVQLGIRGLGSARATDVDDARAWGAKIVTAREIHAAGIEAAIAHVPEGAACIISLDCDGLDPAVMPAVLAKAPGGLTYHQILDLITNVGRRHKLVGLNLVEMVPALDQNNLTAITAGRIIVAAAHAMVSAT